jgi:plastocyanin
MAATPPATSAPAPSTGPATTTSEPAATGPTITISTDFMFTTRSVAAGAMVTVKNLSNSQHTVSADTTAGGFDMPVDPGTTVSFRAPAQPGKYGFHCNIHTFMKGTLDVT